MYIQNKAYNLPLRLMLIGTVSFTYTYISSNDSGSSHNIVRQEDWVAQVFQNLSEEEPLAQLFMVAAYSNKPEKHCQAIEDLIRRYNIGGLIFFQGYPVSQVTLTNRYQQPLYLAHLLKQHLSEQAITGIANKDERRAC